MPYEKCWHPAPGLCHFCYLRGFPSVNTWTVAWLLAKFLCTPSLLREWTLLSLPSSDSILEHLQPGRFGCKRLALVQCELLDGIHLALPADCPPDFALDICGFLFCCMGNSARYTCHCLGAQGVGGEGRALECCPAWTLVP